MTYLHTNDIKDHIRYMLTRIADVDEALDNNNYDEALDLLECIGLNDIDFCRMVLVKKIKWIKDTQ